MKKKIKSKTIFQNSLVKAVPLSVALALISAGNIYAAADKVQVDMGNDKVFQFDLSRINTDQAYTDRVKSALNDAFVNGRSIIVNSGDDWVDFGKEATKGLTIDVMFEDEQFAVEPDGDATLY